VGGIESNFLVRGIESNFLVGGIESNFLVRGIESNFLVRGIESNFLVRGVSQSKVAGINRFCVIESCGNRTIVPARKLLESNDRLRSKVKPDSRKILKSIDTANTRKIGQTLES
jgi:hypothetical protein